jgi:hypothetical protein
LLTFCIFLGQRNRRRGTGKRGDVRVGLMSGGWAEVEVGRTNRTKEISSWSELKLKRGTILDRGSLIVSFHLVQSLTTFINDLIRFFLRFDNFMDPHWQI